MFLIRSIEYAVVRTLIFAAIMAAYLAFYWAVLLLSDNGVVSSLMFWGFVLVFSLTITVLEHWQWGNPQRLPQPTRIATITERNLQ